MSNAFKIALIFPGDLPAEYQAVFQYAADRWSRCVLAALPEVDLGGGYRTSGLLITVRMAQFDGPGGVLGRAGPTLLRPAGAGSAAYLPAAGEMLFERDDLAAMRTDSRLAAVVCHEMGHVLGIGTDVWSKKGLLTGHGTADPRFLGPAAMREYGALLDHAASPVPVENRGGLGVANAHWREEVFGTELMSSYVVGNSFPLSRMTLASLSDLGYTVDLDQAEPYGLPRRSLFDKLFRHRPLHDIVVERTEPVVLPDDSLIPPDS